MTMDWRVEGVARRARLPIVGSLVAGVTGMLLFGSVVAGVGEWMQGRQLRTVGPWAIPGLLLAVAAGTVALHDLRTGKGQRVTIVLGLAVVTSMVLLLVLNPSTAPPVP
jgi:crotonobetainyl-CoA:carnitine CoA-transferase CaiB-like acyl-CoA transferase